MHACLQAVLENETPANWKPTDDANHILQAALTQEVTLIQGESRIRLLQLQKHRVFVIT